MNMLKLRWLVVAMLGGMLIAGPSALAQDTAKDTKKAEKASGAEVRRPNAEAYLAKLTKDLTLTEAQQKDVKAAIEKRATAMKELRAKNLTDRQEVKKAMTKIMEDFNTSVTKVLNDEQKAKWEKMRSLQRGPGQGRPGQGQQHKAKAQ